LAANSAVDKTLLNYLLMICAQHDNPVMLQTLLAKGADPNYQMGDSSVLSIAKNASQNAAAYLSNYATAAPQTNTANQNERKIAELINNAAGLMNDATASMTKAQDARAAGKEKAIWCLRVNDAANEINLSLKYIKEAEAVFSLQYQSRIKEVKELALRNQRVAAGMGCPIFLK